MDGGYERDGFASLVVERLSGDEIEDVPVRRSWTGSMTIGALGGVNDAKRSTSDTDARTTTCPPARPPNVYVGSVERGERDIGITALARLTRALGVSLVEFLDAVPGAGGRGRR